MLIQIRQTVYFRDIAIVYTPPLFGHLPLTNPALRIAERVFNLHCLSLIDQADTLHDVKIFAGRNSGIDPVVVSGEVLRIDDQRITLPTAYRLAVIAADDDVRIGVRPAIKINDA